VLKQTLLILAAPVWLAGHCLSVVTLNMAKETSVPRIVSELDSSSALRSADVMLLQEVYDRTADELGRRLGMSVAKSPEAPGGRDIELAILSRFTLRDVQVRRLPQYSLVFHTRSRYALTAVVDTPAGPVRVVDTHLDTRLNAPDRLAQLETALEAASGRTIVAGDFNSNPFYWIGHVVPLPSAWPQAASVEARMRRAGFSSAIPRRETTFDYLGMHLDWIWLRGGRSSQWRVVPLKFSDHHACWAQVEL
jgi:endonuclease/exonuclease/phosphatase family metal-dependent hydrolase